MRMFRRPFGQLPFPASLPAPRSFPLARRIPQARFALAPLTQAVSLAVLLTLGLQPVAQAQGGGAPMSIDITAQPLAHALTELARQTGTTLVAAPALLAGRTAPAVSGSLTAQQALDKLLAGSGLAGSLEGGVLTVRQAAQASGIGMLPTVTVTARAERADGLPQVYAGGQVARGGQVGLLGNQDFMDTPFSTISYTAEQIQNIQATDIASVIARSDASVDAKQSSTVYVEEFQIRGFNVSAYDMTFNGVRGMAPYYRIYPEIAERVEVLKGPSALLNGMAALGGSVNIVPKRAGDTPIARLTGSYMSDSRFGLHADLGQRLGENKEWGIRFNGLYRDGDTASKGSTQKSGLFALGLDHRGQKVRASLDVYRQNDDIGGYALRGITLADGLPVPRPMNPRRRPGQSWEFANARDEGALLKGEVDLTPNLTAFSSIGLSRFAWDSIFSVYEIENTAGDASVGAGYQKQRIDRLSGEIGVRGKAQTGAIRHEFVVQATGLREKSKLDFERSLLGAGWSGNIYQHHDIVTPDFGNFASRPVPRAADDRQYGVALADTLSWMDDRMRLTLGVRRQTVESKSYDSLGDGALDDHYRASAWTPAAALLFRVNARASVYGNYIEGLQPGSKAPLTAANPGQVFPPYKTRQTELGVKYDAGSFTTTASIFQIERPSEMIDPLTNIYSVNGEQRNRGLEINIFGEPARGTRVMGGVAFIQARQTRTEDGLNQGRRAASTPARIAKLGVERDVVVVPGLTLAGNLTYTGSQYIDEGNTLSIPGWTRLDLGARYAARMANHPATLRASVLNAGNKAYWLSSVSGGVGDARTFLLSASVDF